MTRVVCSSSTFSWLTLSLALLRSYLATADKQEVANHVTRVKLQSAKSTSPPDLLEAPGIFGTGGLAEVASTFGEILPKAKINPVTRHGTPKLGPANANL